MNTQKANALVAPEQKIRMRFSKTGTLKYIGHLDFLRVFQQMVRRANIPVAYSQGFNPHQILSFALPLSLGMASINDYADMTITQQLNKTIMPDQIVDALNTVAPSGLKVTAVYMAAGRPAAAATVAADYALDTDLPREILQKRAHDIMQAKTLVIPKKTKSGIKDTDIRADIFDIAVPLQGEIVMKLSAGSAKFLNPLLVAEILIADKPSPSSLTRLELYQSGENGFYSL